MLEPESIRAMILVKAAPVLTARLEDSMCVAAISLDGDPRWIRLHPVPFRDLADESKFRKYQEVTADAIRPISDRRPESWMPLEGSIRPGAMIGTDHGWSTRRERLEALSRPTMCSLIESNRSGSGPSTPSLAIIRVRGIPKFEVTRRDDEQLTKWRKRAADYAASPSLFDDPSRDRPEYEVVPWRFSYKYRCLEPECRSHNQTIIDWEIVALWYHVRDQQDWREQMRKRFIDEMWSPDRNTELFVGNQERYPQSFLVLGVFWPPRQDLQQSLV